MPTASKQLLSEAVAADAAAQSAVERDLQLARERAKRIQAEHAYQDALKQIESLNAQVGFLSSLPTVKPNGNGKAGVKAAGGAGKAGGAARGAKRQKAAPAGEATAILVLSDWHVEETIDPATVNGLNSYNLDVAAARIRRVFEKAPELIEKNQCLSRITGLTVAVLGDLMSGYIHPELQESNSLSPAEASLFIQEHLCSGLDYLRKHAGVPLTTVACCYGNHGRTTDKPRVATAAANSFEWLLYRQIGKWYAESSGVDWRVADGYFLMLDVQGRRVRFHHGDYLKYSGGVGGITIPINKAIAQWNKSQPADLDIFGHWHQFLPHWPTWIACPCLVGYGPFSQKIKAEYQEPYQALAVIDRERGLVGVDVVFCT